MASCQIYLTNHNQLGKKRRENVLIRFREFWGNLLQQIFAQIHKLQSVTSQIGKLECHKSKQVISLRSPFCYFQIKIWHICREVFIISHERNICQQVNYDDMTKGYESLCEDISFHFIYFIRFTKSFQNFE